VLNTQITGVQLTPHHTPKSSNTVTQNGACFWDWLYHKCSMSITLRLCQVSQVCLLRLEWSEKPVATWLQDGG